MSFAPLSVDRSARDRSTRPAALSSHVWTPRAPARTPLVAAIARVG